MQLIKITLSYLESIIDVPISRGSMSHKIHRESSALWNCVCVCVLVSQLLDQKMYSILFQHCFLVKKKKKNAFFFLE